MAQAAPPKTITLSRGRVIDLSAPNYYRDLLTGIATGILSELAELEKIDLSSLEEEELQRVVTITQIRLLNELYYCLGQLRCRGLDLNIKQAIEDLRDIWNSYIEKTGRPEILKFYVESGEITKQ